jgi:para-nitrobenzyl esterase
MKMVSVLLFSAILSAALKGPIRTESGLVSGTPGKHAGVTVFKGIPYAAPPVGPLRWKPPQPALKWDGVRDGSRFGASCVQIINQEKKPWTHEFLPHDTVSEDCLFLNIWTPAVRANEKRAVLVYLHGGGNIEGSGSVALYSGEGLASKGIVMVTINYRLGVFGFLAHPELSAESENHASGNYGLLDEIAALRWVRANIAAFGGDPERVTVAGQSAGGFHIAALLASPLAKGLFQRAILESGGAPDNTMEHVLAAAEEDGLRLAQAKGAHNLAEFRAMPWREVFAPPPMGSGIRFWNLVDGYVVPASPDQVFADGKENDVPTLAGINADEFGAKPGAPARRNEAIRDRMRVLLLEWAAARAKGSKTPAFLYFFDHVLPGPDAGRFGAFHSAEIPYVLNNLAESDRPFTAADRKVAEMLSSYWVNFAENGDPNGKNLPHWPSASEQPKMVMKLGDRCGPIPAAAR